MKSKSKLPKKSVSSEIDWHRVAVWGIVSIVGALFIYYGFIRGGIIPQKPLNQSGTQIPATQPQSGTSATETNKVNLLVLTDKRCGPTCSHSKILANLKQEFPNLDVKELDYNTPEGKKLYGDSGLTVLPAFLFDSTVKDSSAYKNITNYLDTAGNYLVLRVNSPWDPYCDPAPEHCGEDKCIRRISCRQEMPGQLDIYTASLSPHGAMALDAMKEVLDTFKGEINFTVNYIGELDDKGVPSSPNGQKEIGEDLMDLCAMKYYPDGYKYMDYIWCRNKNLTNTDWQECAANNGMDFEKIKVCAGGNEGQKLLEENFKSSRQLGITSSPTFLVNNKKRLINSVTAVQIEAGICGANKGLSACNRNLTGTIPASVKTG